MKIINVESKQIYDIDFAKAGENTVKCPECSETRKKKNAKPFRWNNTKMVGHCYHCDTSFVKYKPFKSEKQFKRPITPNKTKVSEKALKWLSGRMIKQEVINKMKIYSDTHYMPQFQKKMECICFPYYFNGELINIKYRGAQKSFTQVAGAELILWNIDCIPDCQEVIIVEGEIDLLSFMQAGFDNVVSVPAGAGGKDMSYIDNYMELFAGKKIIIAVDNDIKGAELKAELIRRFGAENCKTTSFEDCKDANEVLCEKGIYKLREVIEQAKDIPVSGIIDLKQNYDDIYNMFQNGLEKGKILGLKEIDELITWELARLAIWTGIPSHGKSSIVDLFNVILNLRYGWKVAYFSPESFPVKYHFARIWSLIQGGNFKNTVHQDDFEMVFDYIHDNFSFIYPEDNFKLETILEKAAYLVKKRGINVLTVDPYNNLEHTKNKGENDSDYVGRVLFELRQFAKKHNCLVNLVAHPTKMKKQLNGLHEKPTMYDINGSANFYNAADYGISVYRYFDENPRIDIDILKVKWRHLGEGGTATMRYNYNNGRLEGITDEGITGWDNSNWLVKDSQDIVTSFEQQENEFNWQVNNDEIPF